MNSPEPTSPATLRHGRAAARTARKRAASIPARLRARELEEAAPRRFDGFSIARICSAFQLRRADHFPAALDDAGFAMLVDLFLTDWFSRRAGMAQSGGMRLEAAGFAQPGVRSLVQSGLAVVTQPAAPDETATINLSRAGRSSLDQYFEDMAGYISAI